MIAQLVPDLSIVIAATDSRPAIARALGALAGSIAEVIVVGESRVVGESSFPSVRLILAPEGSGVPRLRRVGLEAATGRVVVFTEDSTVAEPGWSEAWRSAFEDRSIVAGSGLVEHDPRASALDWAVVFCEYAPFLPPGSTQPPPPPRLAGNNFAVLRDVALRDSTSEVHETELLAAVLREGGSTRTVPGAVVRHVRRFSARQAILDRIRFGHDFGRLRARGLGPVARVAGWVAGPAIFAVQVGRLMKTILPNRDHRGPFLRALPITLGLLAAWSLGEWLGWCRGSLDAVSRPGCKPHGTADLSAARSPDRLDHPPAGYRLDPPHV